MELQEKDNVGVVVVFDESNQWNFTKEN